MPLEKSSPHVAQGKRYAEIGEELDISDRTVEVHVRHAKRKLDVDRRTQLVARYLEPSTQLEATTPECLTLRMWGLTRT